MDARDLIFKILQDRSLDMRLRMAEVLALAHDLQRRVRDNVLYQTDALFEKYKELANKEENVIFGGRLGNYKYYDMDKVIKVALETAKENL